MLRLDPQGQFRKDSERISHEQRKAKEQSLKNTSELEDRFRKTADVVGKVASELAAALFTTAVDLYGWKLKEKTPAKGEAKAAVKVDDSKPAGEAEKKDDAPSQQSTG
jgi:hypothetical protein